MQKTKHPKLFDAQSNGQIREPKTIDEIKPGMIVCCVKMDDPQAVPSGTKGIVNFIDDCGTIHVDWETGSSLGLIFGEDDFSFYGEEQDDALFTEHENETNEITCLLVKPKQKPETIHIKNELKVLQELVGGHIECLTFDECTLIFNEEGRLKHLQPSLLLLKNGKPYDFLVGNVLIVGNDNEDFASLSTEQLNKLNSMLKDINMLILDEI